MRDFYDTMIGPTQLMLLYSGRPEHCLGLGHRFTTRLWLLEDGNRLIELLAYIPIGKCLQRCIGQFTGVQPLSESKASLPACQVERQRILDDGSCRRVND
jgi:hypothetical protein